MLRQMLVNDVLPVFDARLLPPPRLFGLCTDNPYVMTAFRKKVNVETNDSVMKKCFAFGCACHGANNFAKDLLKLVPIKSVFDRAWSVGKYFRNKHRAKAAYEAECRKAYGKTLALVTLSETRWLTSYLMVLSVRRVKTALKQTTLSEEFDVTEDIKQSVLSNDFWKGIDAFCIFLKPVLDVCTIFEADSSPLSYVVPGHMCLKLHLALAVDCDEIAPLADAAGILDMVTIAAAKVDARYKSVHHPLLCLAFMLDPAFSRWQTVDKFKDMKLGEYNIIREALSGLDSLCASIEEYDNGKVFYCSYEVSSVME